MRFLCTRALLPAAAYLLATMTPYAGIPAARRSSAAAGGTPSFSAASGYVRNAYTTCLP